MKRRRLQPIQNYLSDGLLDTVLRYTPFVDQVKLRSMCSRCKRAVERRREPNVDDEWLLIKSAREGELEVVRLLLDRGADVHAKNDDALQWAAYNDHLEVVRLLLDRGADVHSMNDDALQWAAEMGHLEVVALLKSVME